MAPNSVTRKFPPLIREVLLGCAIIVAVVVSRHTSISHGVELSADESELLVQLDRYDRDPVPWRSVDGSTIGPMNPWFLLLLRHAGWPMNYGGIHLLAAGLLGLIALFSYAALRLFLPFSAACLAGLAGVVAIAGCSAVDLLYFATELLPALILGVAVFALVWARQQRPGATSMLAVAAVSGGIAPWAKLQAAPISLLLIGFAAWIAWSHAAVRRPTRTRFTILALVLAGAALPTLVILAAVCAAGVVPDFWASYIVANLGYAGHLRAGDIAQRLVFLLQRSELNGLMVSLAALAVFRVATVRWRQSMANTPLPGIRMFAWSYLGAAVFACIRPPHGFAHYDIFLLGPLIVALGAQLHCTCFAGPETGPATIDRRLGILAAICILAPACVLSAYHYQAGEPLRQHLVLLRRDADRSLTTVVVREITRIAPRATKMVVWGWMPKLYVQSGLRCATRHTNSHFLIDEGPSRDFIRRQFMRDVRATEPDVIVDAVASDCFTWYWDIRSSGIESFPEFAAYVSSRYTLVLSVSGDQAGTPLRVFIRNPSAVPPP